MENKTARFELTLLLEESEQGMKGSLEYNGELFERASIEQMMESYRMLLAALVDNPEQRLQDLPLLASPLAFPPEDEIPANALYELFASQVERSPDATALVYEGKSYTYRELSCKIERVAQHLLAMGIQAGSYIGLVLERSLAAVIAMLAILRAGCSSVPLEEKPPFSQRAGMPSIRCVICEQAMRGHFSDIPCLCIDELIAPPAPLPVQEREKTDILAWYPSLDQTQSQLCRFLQHAVQHGWGKRAVSMGVWSLHSSPTFLYELLLPLTGGGTAWLVPEAYRFPGKTYCEWLATHQITGAYLPEHFLPALLRLSRQGYLCPLQLLLTQSRTFPEQKLQELQQRLPGIEIIHGYGVAGTWQTLYVLDATKPPRRCTPIGYPLVPLLLLDQQKQQVPLGAIGEIYVAGERSETAVMIAGTRFSQTGDRARVLPDGRLELIGPEIQVRNERFSFAAVATLLMEHREVYQAVIVVREKQRLVVYVVPEKEAEWATLKPALQAILQEYIPVSFGPVSLVLLEDVPLDSDGAVCYEALPQEEEACSQGVEAAPRTHLEKEIAAIWCRLLQVEQISIHDNFFDRGGHSLLMIRLHNEIQSLLKLPIAVLDLLKYSTIRELAVFLQECQEKQQEQEEEQQIATRAERQNEALQKRKALMKERRQHDGTLP